MELRQLARLVAQVSRRETTIEPELARNLRYDMAVQGLTRSIQYHVEESTRRLFVQYLHHAARHHGHHVRFADWFKQAYKTDGYPLIGRRMVKALAAEYGVSLATVHSRVIDAAHSIELPGELTRLVSLDVMVVQNGNCVVFIKRAPK